MKVTNFQTVYPFEGYVIKKLTCTGVGSQIDLRRDGRKKLACPTCGTTMAHNRTTQHTAFDLPCGNGPVTV